MKVNFFQLVNESQQKVLIWVKNENLRNQRFVGYFDGTENFFL